MTRRITILCLIASMGGLLLCAEAARAGESEPTGGMLRIIEDDGQAGGLCPLEHTVVEADIVGFVGRTTVTQVFHNPSDQKIEAIYVFPLPQDSAVDDMVMTVGDRRVVGQIKTREEARKTYEAAREAGHVASLLDQERPNIFTQSVANIDPGSRVSIEISYVETLCYKDGHFEWVFPMVVAPRYIPGGGSAPSPTKTGKDTPQVPDGSKITPPVTPEGTRAGHDISLTVNIDAGMMIVDLASELHEVDTVFSGRSNAVVSLKKMVEIPNRDFILRYSLAGSEIGDAFLVHEDDRGKFFTLVLQPPKRVVPEKIVPRELVFVLDTSGSMRGFPLDKARQVMSKAIDSMQPDDTFNVITFAGSTQILWDKPRSNSLENREAAQEFLDSRRGGGGTEMMQAIDAALTQSYETDSIRVVCFMTDGHVGNDMGIIDAVKKNAGTTRVFSFGVGNSVNRFLLDGMAHAGRGEVEYVTLESQGEAAVERFHERILAPVLTDIEVDWKDIPVADVYPKTIPDLFSAKPLMIHGRLTGEAVGQIVLKGTAGDGAFSRIIEIDEAFDAEDDVHDALASLWARAKISDLMNKDLAAMQRGGFPDDLRSQITALGIEFRLMTQFTSFVAVEELSVTVAGEAKTVRVPVEMADGMSYEGVFGKKRKGGGLGVQRLRRGLASAAMPVPAKAKPEQVRSFQTGDSANGLTEEAIEKESGDDEQKLALPLLGLADRVKLNGRDGNLVSGKIRVVNYMVDVIVLLDDLSDETRAALAKLGFEQKAESKAVKMLIGRIDVRKLEELAQLEAVKEIKPVE